VTELSERIRTERIRAGLSQTALAGDDFSPSYVSLIESGRRSPTDAALRVLAERLGTTADFLRYGDKAPSEERARLEIGFARLALANGAPDEARNRLLALDLSTIAPRHHSEALYALGMAHSALGDLDQSVAVLEPLLAEARARRAWLEAATLAMTLVGTYLEAGDIGHSIELGESVLKELEAAGIEGTDEHLRLASTVLWSYLSRGDLLFAAHRASELVALAETKGTRRGRGSIYWNASIVAEQRGDVAEAERLTARALEHLSEGSTNLDLPRLRVHYAWLLLRADPPDPPAALHYLELAFPDLVQLAYEIDIAQCEFETGRAHLMLGDSARAEALARSGLARLDGPPVLMTCDGQILLGDVLGARGDLDGAQACYRWAADMLGMMSATRESAVAWRALGDRMLAAGELADAVQAYERALSEVGIRATSIPVVVQQESLAGGGERFSH
jgi:tetratricopeptide (TPR) repeat protein